MTPHQRVTITRNGEFLNISVIENHGSEGVHGSIRIHGYIQADVADTLNAMAWDDTIGEQVIDSDVI